MFLLLPFVNRLFYAIRGGKMSKKPLKALKKGVFSAVYEKNKPLGCEFYKESSYICKLKKYLWKII